MAKEVSGLQEEDFMKIRNNLITKKEKALKRFVDSINGRLLTHLNSCVHCGLCAETCHYYIATGEERYIPAYKIDQLISIYKRYHTIIGKLIPKWTGARDFNDEAIKEMVDVIFGACTMCGRCSLHCSIGVDIPFIVRTARSMLVELELVPKGLQSTIDAAVETGNNMRISHNELVETLKWLEEDLKMEVNDENACIPLDKKDKHILYTLNPREPKFFPMSISAMAMIFYAADESWTISTKFYDVTNYAYYSGDDDTAGELMERLCNEMGKLNAEILVTAECGHGSRSIRWEGPNWIGRRYPFNVITAVELIAKYIRDGRIKLDPSKNKEVVTLHDPCNLVRSGGVIEEQRYILKNACSNFVEMYPNRENNYCCGGGGGQLSMGEFRDRRIEAGKIKADQIKKTGATIVATPCHNCIDQLIELNKEYNLGVKIKTISEIVADSLIL